MHANLCECVWMEAIHVSSSLPVVAGPATVAECRSSPTDPEPPPPPPGTRSSPGARHATQTGSKSDSAAPQSSLYTEGRELQSDRQQKTYINGDILLKVENISYKK